MPIMVSPHTLIVGAGIYGVTAALELRARGHRVTVVDPGPLPHSLAASTDISKVIRMEYGPEDAYMGLMEEARDGWLRWNAEWAASAADPLYHETGVVMVCRAAMEPGGFEYDSWQTLRARGHAPERMSAEDLVRRFPAWSSGLYVDGFFHAQGGYAESGRVVERLIRSAVRSGVSVVSGCRMTALVERDGRVRGVRDEHGNALAADHVVVAAGAWTGRLLGHLGDSISASGHPVFHLRPPDPELFRAERFPTFTADVARTGYYGFPLHPTAGIVKIANHGLGVAVDPDGPRNVPRAEVERLRDFLAATFPALADAEIVSTRLCLYADTQDEDFWIARDPERDGLTVAGGGSGHGFKFAPVLGAIIADAVEGRDNRWLERFRWRPDVRLAHGGEAARCHTAH